MKKIVLSITLIFSLFLTFSVSTAAATPLTTTSKTEDSATVIHYEDGSKLTISSPQIEDINGVAPLSTNYTKSARIEANFEDSDGNIEWVYTLHATFSYTYASSAVCTDTYYTQTIYEGNWTFSNGAATKSGATATGTGNYIKKVLFITAKDIDINLTLTCDKYGNIT